MKNKLNNKGYMLIEIILASALAFGLAYFILDLTIKLKNKNDDLLYETLVMTDKTIVMNKLMNYMIEEEKDFTCNIHHQNNIIFYKDKDEKVHNIDIIDKSAIIGDIICENKLETGDISINIPLKVKQINNKNFDISLNYKYTLNDEILPSCDISVNNMNIIVTFSDDGGSGLNINKIKSENNGWNFVDENTANIVINKTGDIIFKVYDNVLLNKNCIVNISSTQSYPITQSIPYCGYTCRRAGVTYYDIPSVRWCVNPSPGNCVQVSSWYSNDIIGTGYNCSSGYTKINNSYCYKII